MSTPAKRPAYESGAALLRRTRFDPDMPRPSATVAGAVLVMLRGVAGVVWAAAAYAGWMREVEAGTFDLFDLDVEGLDQRTAVLIVAVSLAVVYGIVILFGVLILRGRNAPRVLVMLVSVLSISGAFVGWWVEGQSITISTTLVTLSLDILVLLALSSRDAAAYARRNERI